MLRVVEEGSQPGARARFDRVACGRSCECETHWYGDTCEINLNHKMGDARPLQYYEDEDEVEEEASLEVRVRFIKSGSNDRASGAYHTMNLLSEMAARMSASSFHMTHSAMLLTSLLASLSASVVSPVSLYQAMASFGLPRTPPETTWLQSCLRV